MASNIGTTAVFTTANMKPASGEQIDALWGQNIADNTGKLYYRKFFGPSFFFSQSDARNYNGTFFFEKQPGMVNFMGSLVGTHDTGATIGTILMNGTAIFTKTFSGGTLYSQSIGTSLSGISDGAFVPVVFQWTGNVGNIDTISFTGWQQP